MDRVALGAAGLIFAVAAGCGDDDAARRHATALGQGSESLPAEELERGRRDGGWRLYVVIDSAAAANGTASYPEEWDSISADAINDGPIRLPLPEDAAGPTVATVQILLDRALFSPGVIDGLWGKNTEKAVYWLQRREGLSATGRVDSVTVERLRSLASITGPLVREHPLSEDDLAGPFVQLPDDIYERADLDCLCFESLAEKLGERFHATPELLAQLNPGVSLETLSAGDVILVPAVREPTMPVAGDVAEIVVSDGGFYLHARDSEGRILYHFPTTLGSEYAPTPAGEYTVTAIAHDPTWHYQPELLVSEPDDRDEAILPPGPNSPVGVVWIALSRPHYGIHGTSAPETIGYTTSNGCVRLTNWDALFLASRIGPDTPVNFRDTTRSSAESD